MVCREVVTWVVVVRCGLLPWPVAIDVEPVVIPWMSQMLPMNVLALLAKQLTDAAADPGLELCCDRP